ncbi:MAG TPA: hypothetical protein VH415_11220 [Nitrososphaeraceae archaeon]|jgi:hypothetical protein
MVKFEMIQDKPEDTVFGATAQPTISVTGQIVKVGTHSVSFSGRAMLSMSDYNALVILAEGKNDNRTTQFDCEIIVGPAWTEIYQCSFQISGGKYSNWNSDEDDWQGWEIRANAWEPVLQGTTKKIRLKFSMAQFGQHTKFEGVSYQVIATGDIDPTTPPTPPVLCDKRIYDIDRIDSSPSVPPHMYYNVKDGDDNTYWLSEVMIHPNIMVFFPFHEVCRVDIRWQGLSDQYFRIALLDAYWYDVYSGKATGTLGSNFEKYEFTGKGCYGIRITVTESDPDILPKSQAAINEIEIYGKPD